MKTIRDEISEQPHIGGILGSLFNAKANQQYGRRDSTGRRRRGCQPQGDRCSQQGRLSSDERT